MYTRQKSRTPCKRLGLDDDGETLKNFTKDSMPGIVFFVCLVGWFGVFFFLPSRVRGNLRDTRLETETN